MKLAALALLPLGISATTTEPIECPAPVLEAPDHSGPLTLDEGRHRDLLAEAQHAENGEPVEISPGVFVTITDAHQSTEPNVDGYPLVAAHVAYENTSDDIAMFAYGVVCSGTTDSGVSLEDDSGFDGALPAGTADEADVLVHLPSLYHDDQTCDGPAWLIVTGNESAVWPVCGDVTG